ncbi:MAG: prepilin-type N-terminal cleavage/methylation domain-containing protein [Gemmatimonadota bacterium]
MKPRPGFTLLELLTVLVIIGLLATIATNRFWAVKERAYKAAMRSDLRTLATQQERYFESNYTYAATAAALTDFSASSGVTVTVTWNTNQGWAAISQHPSVPGEQCGYFTGPAPAAIATPAIAQGIIACE